MALLSVRGSDVITALVLIEERTVSFSSFQRPFSRWNWVSRYQNVSILDFIGAKDNGGGE